MRKAYPYLDWVDRKLWPKEPVQNDPNFPKIEAIVVLGEPLAWERALQLILDVLQTNGDLSRGRPDGDVEQIPLMASNMDLQVLIWVIFCMLRMRVRKCTFVGHFFGLLVFDFIIL